jgi:hypothetical protein
MSGTTRAFKGSNRAQMMSNTLTTQVQGGGSKKAGLWPQVGRESYTSVIMGITTGVQMGRCAPCSLKSMQITYRTANAARPIGSTRESNTAWKIPKAP